MTTDTFAFSQSTPPDFRCGLVALIGRTNAGKSTLLNALAKRKISIVSPRPQTTRDAIQGVVNRSNGQIVFVDTPGFFKTHQSERVELHHKRALTALRDIDLVIHVADPTRPWGDEDRMVSANLGRVEKPIILCLNKSDLPRPVALQEWLEHSNKYTALVEVSALEHRNLEALVSIIIMNLPVGHPLYPADESTNASVQFRLAEIIREKIYLLCGDEIPYKTEVIIQSFDERPGESGKPMAHIKAAIITPKDRYQRMLIGRNAQMIRTIGREARLDIQELVKKKVFLDLAVLVDGKMII